MKPCGIDRRHPAFNWPLLPGLAKEAYALNFQKEEPAPIRRLSGGLCAWRWSRRPFAGKDTSTL
jgi:hypothetical protein